MRNRVEGLNCCTEILVMKTDIAQQSSPVYNSRPHQWRWCIGKTPMQTFLDAMPMTKEKMIAA
jgi:hypothetical protein